MRTVTKPSRSLATDNRGNTSLEYALLASVMVAGLLVALPKLGDALTKAFSTIAVTIDSTI